MPAKIFLHGSGRYSAIAEVLPDRASLTREGDSMIMPGTFSKSMRITNRGKTLPDVYENAGVTFVSGKLKDVIESLEPDIHHFEPLDVLYRDKTPVTKKYYTLDVRQRLDAIDIEKSNGSLSRHEVINGVPHAGGVLSVCPGAFVFKKDVIGGRHFWRGQKYYYHHFFISDALAEAIKKARIDKFMFDFGPAV